MSENKRTRIAAYFANEIAMSKSLEQKLADDGRIDEAIFTKVRTNVFSLSNSVFSTAVKKTIMMMKNTKVFHFQDRTNFT